jgi:hypothetical protein
MEHRDQRHFTPEDRPGVGRFVTRAPEIRRLV